MTHDDSIDVSLRSLLADALPVPEHEEDYRRNVSTLIARHRDKHATPWWRRLRGRTLAVLVAGAVLLASGTVYAGVYVADVLIGPQPDQVVWTFKTGGPVRSPVAVADGVVYVGSDDGCLYALDGRSGQRRWTFKTGGDIRSLPAVAGGMVYCRSGDGYLYALDVRSGRQRWKFVTGPPADSSPTVAGGVVYVAGDAAGPRTLYALDGRSGRERWKTKTGGGPYVTSPAVSGGVVYFGVGSLEAFDAETGERMRGFKAAGGGGVFRATPVVFRGLVYFRTNGFMNGIWAVDAQSGRKRWFFVAGGQPPACSSPTVSGGVVYCNGAGTSAMSHGNRAVFRLHALDARSGEEIWASDGSDEGSVAASGAVVCFTDEKTLYAVDVKTGRELWQYETGGPIGSAPAIADGVVYVGSDDGYLYAVK